MTVSTIDISTKPLEILNLKYLVLILAWSWGPKTKVNMRKTAKTNFKYVVGKNSQDETYCTQKVKTVTSIYVKDISKTSQTHKLFCCHLVHS